MTLAPVFYFTVGFQRSLAMRGARRSRALRVPLKTARPPEIESACWSRLFDQLHAALRALVRFFLPHGHCRHWTIRSMAQDNLRFILTRRGSLAASKEV